MRNRVVGAVAGLLAAFALIYSFSLFSTPEPKPRIDLRAAFAAGPSGALAVGNTSANGPIGGLTAAQTVDNYGSFVLTQTTTGITATLPTPTNPTPGRQAVVSSLASNSATLTMYGVQIPPGSTFVFQWDGTEWSTNSGVAGVQGDAGISAFTTTTATFTQPNVTYTSVVDVALSAPPFSIGEIVYIAGGGYYLVTGVGTGMLVVENLGYPGNASPTTVIAIGALVSPGGLQGPQGASASTTPRPFSYVQMAASLADAGTPISTFSTSAASYTVGMEFYTTVAGHACDGAEIWWIESDAGTDTVQLELWDSLLSGTHLATTTVAAGNGYASGTWSPVTLVPGKLYLVSYYVTSNSFTPFWGATPAQASGGGQFPNPSSNNQRGNSGNQVGGIPIGYDMWMTATGNAVLGHAKPTSLNTLGGSPVSPIAPLFSQ